MTMIMMIMIMMVAAQAVDERIMYARLREMFYAYVFCRNSRNSS